MKCIDTAHSWTLERVPSGNYGELYDRFPGKGGLNMDRGPNRLWTDGGLMISHLWQ